MKKTIEIMPDLEGRKIVIINDIRFKGKRNVNWEGVEKYLKEYVGRCYEIVDTSDKVFIGADFPSELKGSSDTKRLFGANAKAKANATQGIPVLLQCAVNKRWQENVKEKHNKDAKFGWYRFTTRFALPIYYNDSEKVERFNVYQDRNADYGTLADGNLYLYDMVNIKKKRAPRLSNSCTVTNPLPFIYYNNKRNFASEEFNC